MDPGTDTGAGFWLKIIQISKTKVIKICLNYETLYEKITRYFKKNID